MIALPLLLIVVFALHFRQWSDFFVFHAQYTPTPAQVTVTRLIAQANRSPMIHDPHVIAYLILPLLPLCALGLYALGRTHRPILARAGVALSLAGSIYLGGLFGMWTAFFRGMGDVDAHYTEGAIATFGALTAPHGAFLLTTTLAKLFMVGLLLQVAALWGRPGIARSTILTVGAGCLLFLAFWDIDNVMLLAAAALLAGFSQIRRPLTGQPAGAS